MRVEVVREGPVAVVTLNRPEKRNALDREMFEGLEQAGDRLREDRTLRAVVLTGAGPAFSAGLDFASFLAAGPEGAARLLERGPGSPANRAQRAAWVWREVPVPVIAAVRGAAFGGGLQLALGADLRYLAPDARLSVMEIEWGLVPDMTGARTLLELLPLDVAKDLTFTGRIVEAEEAVRLGLGTRLCEDPLEAALETARAIARRSPHAIRAGKRLLDAARDLDTARLYLLETEMQVGLLGSRNQMEAAVARMEKREPSFEDPD